MVLRTLFFCYCGISVLRTMCWEIKACNLNIILTREVRGVSDQVLNARAFDSAAAFISCWVVSGTRVTRSCVAYCCLLAESCSWDGLLDCADQNTLLWKTRQIHCRWKAWWYCGARQQMSERTERHLAGRNFRMDAERAKAAYRNTT